jgi:hypothetical protein
MIRFSSVLFSEIAPNAIAFSDPVRFSEALQAREIQSVLPTTLTSEELAKIDPDILSRALFSARTVSAEYLQKLADIIDRILRGELDYATGRLELKKFLDEIGYAPLPPEEGKITDLSSSLRINLVLNTQTAMARGYGQWIRGQDPVILDEWPAQELHRAYLRKKTRDQGPLPWRTRWQMAGGELVRGRMIAIKNTAVWDNLGSRQLFADGLGNPYPPFAFNSGMRVRSITREEAMSLGLIDRDTQIEPQDRGFNEDLQVPAAVREAALRQVLEEEGYQFKTASDGTEVLMP